MILTTDEIVRRWASDSSGRPVRLKMGVHDGALYTSVQPDLCPTRVWCSVCVAPRPSEIAADAFGRSGDRVRLIVGTSAADGREVPPIRGYVRHGDGRWNEVVVRVERIGDLASRLVGVLETDRLKSSTVLVAGNGSMGSEAALEMVKAGVGHLILADRERLEIANAWRHVGRLSSVGRWKTQVVAEAARDKNPAIQVQTSETDITWANMEHLRPLVRQSHATVCLLDTQEPRLVLNQLCVEEGKPMVAGGAFRRATGLQVFKYVPGKGPCYQCFVKALPQAAAQREVASAEAAARLSYTDRPMPIEPGLANDLTPAIYLIVKLTLMLLMREGSVQQRSLERQSLEEDLSAPWFWFFNRRAPGEWSERFPPLACIDQMTAFRWYAIDLPRDPACPSCGRGPDPEQAVAAAAAELKRLSALTGK